MNILSFKNFDTTRDAKYYFLGFCYGAIITNIAVICASPTMHNQFCNIVTNIRRTKLLNYRKNIFYFDKNIIVK